MQYGISFLNSHTLKRILKNTDVFVAIQNYHDKSLKKRFFNTYRFSNDDLNKFILFLRKGIYPYECTDD